MATFKPALPNGGSTFIRDQLPTLYGNQQNDYVLKVQGIVKTTSDRFKQAVAGGEDLQALFRETLSSLAAQRAAIAKEHKTPNAHDFGRRRDGDASFDTSTSTTLSTPYVKYNEPLARLFKSYLGQMITTGFKPDNSNIMNWPTSLGRSSAISFSLLKREEGPHIFDLFSYESYLRLCTLCNIAPPASKEKFSLNLFPDLVMNKAAMATLKEKASDEYNRLRITLAIAQTIRRYPPVLFMGQNKDERSYFRTAMTFLELEKGASIEDILKKYFSDFSEDARGRLRTYMKISLEMENGQGMLLQQIIERYSLVAKDLDWIVGTLHGEIDGKRVPLSQYLTWFKRDNGPDPIEAATGPDGYSIFTILHQDPFLTESMIDDMAKVFEQALKCKSEDVETIKNNVKLIQHELAHNMPFHRGTAAISESLEMAIYDSHGYALSYNQDKMVNLEAITAPLATFAKNYNSAIQLEKKS